MAALTKEQKEAKAKAEAEAKAKAEAEAKAKAEAEKAAKKEAEQADKKEEYRAELHKSAVDRLDQEYPFYLAVLPFALQESTNYSEGTVLALQLASQARQRWDQRVKELHDGAETQANHAFDENPNGPAKAEQPPVELEEESIHTGSGGGPAVQEPGQGTNL